jgi:branched-chain amino acid transport system permease protein
LTHGNNGITNVPRIDLPLVSGGISVFLVTLLVLALFFWIQDSLRSSRLGVSMLATRGDEEAAASLGISIPNTRILAFVFSAVPTVLGGVLLAQLTTYVHPDQFEVTTSVSLIAIPIIGGRGWRWAPILGALFVVALPEYVRFLSEYRLVLYGVLLTAIALFFPDGMRQIGQEIAGLWSRRGRGPEPKVPGPTLAEQADQPPPEERIAVSPRKRASGE